MEKVKKAVLLLTIPFEWLGIAYVQWKIVRFLFSIVIIAILVMFGLFLRFKYDISSLMLLVFGYVIYYLIEIWLKSQISK
jgi:ethanolamine transporter EutH